MFFHQCHHWKIEFHPWMMELVHKTPHWIRGTFSFTQRNDRGHTSISNVDESESKPDFIYLEGKQFVRSHPNSKGSKHVAQKTPYWVRALLSCTWRNDGCQTSINVLLVVRISLMLLNCKKNDLWEHIQIQKAQSTFDNMHWTCTCLLSFSFLIFWWVHLNSIKCFQPS